MKLEIECLDMVIRKYKYCVNADTTYKILKSRLLRDVNKI